MNQTVVGTSAVNSESAARKVIVIDDELSGLKHSDLPSPIVDFLSDMNSPEVEALWPFAPERYGFKALSDEDPEVVRNYLSSDAFLHEVLLNADFRLRTPPLLATPLSAVWERFDKAAQLADNLRSAFPATNYDLTFVAERPAVPTDLMNYDFVVLDLVLRTSASAIDELVDYLRDLGKLTHPSPLPCIIVLSSRGELTTERARFSTESNISTAGLLLLPKAEVRRETFGVKGLVLCAQQLDRQRDIAQRMRVFMLAWTSSLDHAKDRAQRTLWNLDAAAMQQIHLSAFNDSDPYDEHLNALIMREYLWHVEGSADVEKAIADLDGSFQKEFNQTSPPATIAQRFIAPLVTPKVGRDLVSHFTWTGFRAPAALDSMGEEEALKKFNRLVPFGALLAPKELAIGKECLVHLTQQCDLNTVTRPSKPGQPQKPLPNAIFAAVSPVLVGENKIPMHESASVACGLTIDGQEYDFELVPGRQFAIPVSEFIQYAKSNGLHVAGRMRHDIAMNFLVATANHMTRPAALRTTRVEARDVKLFLYGRALPEPRRLAFLNDEGHPATVRIVKHQAAKRDELCFFPDDACVRIALWISQAMATYCGIADLDVAKTCNALSVGLKHKGCLIGIVDFWDGGPGEGTIDEQFPAASAPPKKVRLLVVEETARTSGNV